MRSSVTSLTGQLSGGNEALFKKKFNLLLTLAVLVSLFIMQGWYNPQEAQAYFGSLKANNPACISCHTNLSTTGSIVTSIMGTLTSGTTGPTIYVAPSTTFEVDWQFAVLGAASSNDCTGALVVVPNTFGAPQAGTSNAPGIASWFPGWDVADGVSAGWTATFGSITCNATAIYGSTNCYWINYNGSPWD
ncbi:MAG: hypothetical protein WAV13_15190, partial [Thermodesulfovibrionales bacterium]